MSKDRIQPRPHGFQNYITLQGFHSLYLVTTARNRPVKVGITDDPVQRLAGLQVAHFEFLRFHRFWWLPGRPIASRIERAFKQHFARTMIRGEWFDLPPREAEAFVEASIRCLGTWGIEQRDMLALMDQWESRRVPMLTRRPHVKSGQSSSMRRRST
jgi:hypothetical protein